MNSNLYHSFFAKDKPLRHISQHLLVAMFSFLILSKVMNIPVSIGNILLFMFFTLIPDVDGVISVFTTCKNIDVAKEIRRCIAYGKFTDAATAAATHHKKLNRLILHNMIFFIVIMAGFIVSILLKNTFWIISCGAVITHFLFDTTDDLYQIKHLRNWYWFANPTKLY